MTTNGGVNNAGVIYSFDPSTLVYTKLFDFSDSDGTNPLGSLIQGGDGLLYGMCQHGGISNGLGILFSFDTSNNSYSILHEFSDPTGSNPYGSLIQSVNNYPVMYGMTFNGGSYGAGTIFSFDPSDGTYSVIKNFLDLSVASNPMGDLVEATDGLLYGMTSSLDGTSELFSISMFGNPKTYTTLRTFDQGDGNNPRGNLIQGRDGLLYGMTYGGGSSYSKDGVIFSFDPSIQEYKVLHNLDDSQGDGYHPFGSLLQGQAGDDKFYGVAYRGGANNNGTIFSIDPANSTFTKLVDYNGANGRRPQFGSQFTFVSGPTPEPPAPTASGMSICSVADKCLFI